MPQICSLQQHIKVLKAAVSRRKEAKEEFGGRADCPGMKEAAKECRRLSRGSPMGPSA